MAQYGGNQGGRMGQTDEYGNRVPETGGMGTGGMGGMGGEYGTHQGGTGMGGTGGTYGTHGGTTGMGGMTGGEYGTHQGGTGTGMGTTGMHTGHHDQGHQQLRRSDSSSSSEDDGQGGRRKKGMKEKIMEKIPGGGHGHKEGEYGGTGQQYGGQTNYGGTDQSYTSTEGGEKKGMMDKIKDKIPGMH